MDRILSDSQSKIKLEVRDESGTLVNVDATTTVTAKATDSAGTEITGSPFTAQLPGGVTGIYEVTLSPARTAQMDVYDAEWTLTLGGAVQKRRTQYEVVGGFHFGIAEARTFDNKVLTDAVKYSADDIRNARELIEEDIETMCGVAFVPRARRVTLDGTGKAAIYVPDKRVRKLVSGSIDAVALTAAEITDVAINAGFRRLTRKEQGAWAAGHQNIVLFYERGFSQPPDPIRRAALKLLRYRLVPSNIDDLTLSFTDELGTRQFPVPGQRFPTGIPEVDAIIARFDESPPGVA